MHFQRVIVIADGSPGSSKQLPTKQPINRYLHEFGQQQLPRVRIAPPVRAQIPALIRDGDKAESCTLIDQAAATHTDSLEMKTAADNRRRPNKTMGPQPIGKRPNLA